MKRRPTFLLVLVVLVLGLRARAASASEDASPPVPPAPFRADPLFPGAGRGSASMATGVPFLAMGEVAYAPTKHFAVGGLLGVTPNVLGIGLRPRLGVSLGAWTRATIVSPMLYYPSSDVGPPWVLAQPALRFEQSVGASTYVHASAGLIGAMGLGSPNERNGGEVVVTYNGRRVVERSTPWGLWNTVGGGAAFTLFDRTVLFADAMVILRGVRLAGSEWVGGPPFSFTIGLTRVL